MRRREIYENIFSAKTLFIAGLLIMPALLFNPGTEYRVIQFLFFWLLAWLSGKKINPVLTIFVIFFIITFNLVIPYGKVLYSFGMFKITSGALTAGIHRAVTFQALIMLSKFCIRGDLRIPGAFGELLGESLRIFSVMTDRKYQMTGKNIIAEIDSLMLELGAENTLQSNIQKTKTKPVGYVVLAAIIIISWLLFFINVF